MLASGNNHKSYYRGDSAVNNRGEQWLVERWLG
jgi:hypothetical protein